MNPRIANIAPSLIRAIAAKRRPTSIDLGLGEPSLRPTQDMFEAASAWVAEHGCPYTTNLGDAELRAAIAAHYAYPGMDAAENVCVTNGSQEALFVAIAALLDPARDELLVVEPAFGSYVKLAEFHGVAARTVSLDPAENFAFNVERIVAAIGPATKMLALCSPCNPTGRALRAEDGRALAARLTALGPDAPVVLFDEVYRELTYLEGAAEFARLYPKTIVVNSLSKSNALTGLRLGWAIAPRAYVEPIAKAHAWATSAASTFAQRLALGIFRTPDRIAEHGAWYRARAAETTALLAEARLAHTPIEGTFYTMLRMPEGGDSIATALTLADADDVLVIPGRAFGACAEGWLRLSFVAEPPHVREALRRIRRRLFS